MAGIQRVRTYTHTQTTAATSWNVNHNLNTHPVVDVLYDDAGVLTKMLPLSITYVDANNIVIAFSVARAGVARLAG